MIKSVKSWGGKIKNSCARTCRPTKQFFSKYRRRICLVVFLLLIIAMIVALVMSSIQGIDLTDQAVIINYTEYQIKDKKITNQVNLIGLNSKLFAVPKRNFLIYYDNEPRENSQYWAPLINARVEEGTRVTVSARVLCQVVAPNLKAFLEQYGLDWSTYVIQKNKNVIIQAISKTKFYDLNNTVFMDEINSQFAYYKQAIKGYPFTFKLVNIQIRYPENSFSVNNTLGISLLTQKSMLSQLNTNYERLNAKYQTDIDTINSYASRVGQLEGLIAMKKMEIASLTANWIKGLQLAEAMFNNTTALRQYMWVYFQKVYNSSYSNS